MTSDEKLIDILDVKTIENSCSSCERGRKFTFDNISMKTSYGKSLKSCKKCLVSIARRKLGWIYIQEYIKTSGKIYFSVASVVYYVESVHDDEHARIVAPVFKYIIQDMVNLELVDIYSHSNNGYKYKINEKYAITEKAEKFILTKGYGYSNGIKSVEDFENDRCSQAQD